jgi:hypothetical protein
MTRMILFTGAALLVGTSLAAAQVPYEPPGWSIQRQGILESQGIDPRSPEAYGRYEDYGGYGYGGPYTEGYGGYVVAPGYYRAAPPGARIQTRGYWRERGY